MTHGLQRIWIAFEFNIIAKNVLVDRTLLRIGHLINIGNAAKNHLDVRSVYLALRIHHELRRGQLSGRELLADQVKALSRLHILRERG
ncbi:hypothetical protein D3C75_1178260 [compost metagenome]